MNYPYLVGSLMILSSLSFASAQGPLTPPGPPAPTMKTLDQIEARIPLTGKIINTPGSYYLTGNITLADDLSDQITIRADDVTLDLNGYTITMNSTSKHPIKVEAAQGNPPRNITVKNGSISGGSIGIMAPITSLNIQVEGVTFKNQQHQAINMGMQGNSRVINCRVEKVAVNNQSAIFAREVIGCTVMTASPGIRCETARDCEVEVTAAADGNYAALSAINVTNCKGRSVNSGIGITATSVENSRGLCSGTGIGIFAVDRVGNSTAVSGGMGIQCSNLVVNSAGESHSTTYAGIGIQGRSVIDSVGKSARHHAISATALVKGSDGITSSTTIDSRGIHAPTGIVSESRGEAGNGDGIEARNVSFSHGKTSNGGRVGIRATIATGCTFEGGSSITFKYGMP
jgi:hypothetical protein